MERSQGSQGGEVNDPCDRCFSESSPVVIFTGNCPHQFCVKCILYLWSREKLREPCLCPYDGIKMWRLRPRRAYVPEEISSLVCVYNRLFNPPYYMDMAESKFYRNISWLYLAEGALCVVGLLAYVYKLPK